MSAKFSLLFKIALGAGALAALGGAFYAGRNSPSAGPSAASAQIASAAPGSAAAGPGKAGGGANAAGAAAAGPPPTTVEVAKVLKVALPQTITAVGSLRSDETVILRPAQNW